MTRPEKYASWPHVRKSDGEGAQRFVETLARCELLNTQQQDDLFFDLMEILDGMRIAMEKMKSIRRNLGMPAADPIDAYLSLLGLDAWFRFELIEHIKSASRALRKSIRVMERSSPLKDMPDDEFERECFRRGQQETEEVWQLLAAKGLLKDRTKEA